MKKNKKLPRGSFRGGFVHIDYTGALMRGAIAENSSSFFVQVT